MPSEFEKRSMREMLQSYRKDQLAPQIHTNRQTQERQKKQAETQDRIQRIQEIRKQRRAIVQDVDVRVRKHVMLATQSIHAALRLIGKSTIPRGTPEGKIQQHNLRALEDASRDLRKLAKALKYSAKDVDMGVDIDLDSNEI